MKTVFFLLLFPVFLVGQTFTSGMPVEYTYKGVNGEYFPVTASLLMIDQLVQVKVNKSTRYYTIDTKHPDRNGVRMWTMYDANGDEYCLMVFETSKARSFQLKGVYLGTSEEYYYLK